MLRHRDRYEHRLKGFRLALPPPSSPATEQRPRVAFIGLRGLPADRPKAGGGETGLEEIASRLAPRGYDITVYCRWHYNRRPSTPYKGIRLISLPSIPTKSLDNVTHSLLATLHVAFADTADVIQYCGMGTALFVPLARLLGKKSAVAIDGVDWETSEVGKARAPCLEAWRLDGVQVGGCGPR